MSRQDQLEEHLWSLRGRLAEQAAQVDGALAKAAQQEKKFHELIAHANEKLLAAEAPAESEKTAEERRAEELAHRAWGERREVRYAGAESDEEDEAPVYWSRSGRDDWGGNTRRFGHDEDDD
jgi:protein subunit release factor B